LKGDNLILYTAENKSLALLEKIESFSTKPGIKPPAFILLEIELPDEMITYLKDSQLPNGWNDENNHAPTQTLGMRWLIKNESLALSVPSVISYDRNILINPQHLNFKFVKIVKSIKNFPIDKRLIK
jgi:RES domain-containing protein